MMTKDESTKELSDNDILLVERLQKEFYDENFQMFYIRMGVLDRAQGRTAWVTYGTRFVHLYSHVLDEYSPDINKYNSLFMYEHTRSKST